MDRLYINGQIITPVGVRDAMIIRDNRFLFVGDYEDAIAQFIGYETIDLHRQVVIPGFNDSHLHLFGTAFTMERLSLHQASSITHLQQLIREYIQSNAFNGMYVGARGFNQDFFVEGRFPTKNELDQISTQIPIIATRVCGHIAVLNTKALELSHIDSSTLVDGGEIDFESGLLTEKALNLIFTNSQAITKDEVKRLLINGMNVANSYGITTLQTDDLMHAFPDDFEKMIEVYDELDKEGLLTCRIRVQSQLPDIKKLCSYITKGYANKYYSDKLKMGPLKILTDGTLGARTAAMSMPYADDPSTKGLLTYSDEELYELVKTAHIAKMSVAMHAIGDRAMIQVLDAYERVLSEYPRVDHRHTIIHCQITTKAILERMKRLDVYAAVQPIFIDYDMSVVYDRVGKLADTSYAFYTMQQMGINVAIGTDAPVESMNPFDNLRAATTRQSKKGKVYLEKEKMPIDVALDCYTYASAKQTRDEHYLGLIQEQYLADFVVLNITDIRDISLGSVDYVVFDGVRLS
ncbi:MAG: amidohydrolase [Candidatus Izemoplasmatales bacterium]|nr:amidohydrolase [Candidatus Izemoplasmatales bacterium]